MKNNLAKIRILPAPLLNHVEQSIGISIEKINTDEKKVMRSVFWFATSLATLFLGGVLSLPLVNHVTMDKLAVYSAGYICLVMFCGVRMIVLIERFNNSVTDEQVKKIEEIVSAMSQIENASLIGEQCWTRGGVSGLRGFCDDTLVEMARAIISIEDSDLPKQQKKKYIAIEKQPFEQFHRNTVLLGLGIAGYEKYFNIARIPVI